MDIWNVVGLMGGLAMFIFGMNLMSDGLKLVAGSYLKKILEKLTQNRIVAMMVGAGLTALIQSSNAMCVMVVGFVNAGMMELERSDGGEDRYDDHRPADCVQYFTDCTGHCVYRRGDYDVFQKNENKKCGADHRQPGCVIYRAGDHERGDETAGT